MSGSPNTVNRFPAPVFLSSSLITMPGVRAGSRTDTFSGAVDFVPSLLGACGVPLPDGFPGRDVSLVWRDSGPPGDPDHAPGGTEAVHLMNKANGWPDRTSWVRRWRGVHAARYTYARWFDNERGSVAVRPIGGSPRDGRHRPIDRGETRGRGDGGPVASLDGGDRRPVLTRHARSSGIPRCRAEVGRPAEVAQKGHRVANNDWWARRDSNPRHLPCKAWTHMRSARHAGTAERRRTARSDGAKLSGQSARRAMLISGAPHAGIGDRAEALPVSGH